MIDLIPLYTLITGLMAVAPSTKECALPPSAEISRLKRQAEVAVRAGDTARAITLRRQVLERYPACNFRERPDTALRMLNLLKKLPAIPERSCDNPVLQAARLTRAIHADLAAIPDGGDDLNDWQKKFAERLAALPRPAREAATFLDGPPLPAAEILDRHAQTLEGFGACPELRAALERHVSAAIPPTLPEPPTCDAKSEQARDLLRKALAALEQAEPGKAAATAEYLALEKRLAQLNGKGVALAATHERALAEADVDRAASTWAELARKLPACSAYLTLKHDAAHAAFSAWQKEGNHRPSASERYDLSKALLDDIIRDLEGHYGAGKLELREHESLTRLAATLKPPLVPKEAKPMRPVVTPDRAPVERPKPTKWISRYVPERNLIELGAFAGIIAPSSGLLAKNGNGSHQLFDPYQQRDSIEAINNGTGTSLFYKPYRKIAPEFGLRLAYYPLSFLGGELEGGVMPTKTDPQDGSAGARATLFSLRGHLIGQLPLWRIAPFVLIGGGALGTRGALGADTDPTFNFGVGVKFFASKYTMIRIDLRDSIGDHFDRTAGGTHYPEVLLGMSFTLNRRSDGEQKGVTRLAPSAGKPPKAGI